MWACLFLYFLADFFASENDVKCNIFLFNAVSFHATPVKTDHRDHLTAIAETIEMIGDPALSYTTSPLKSQAWFACDAPLVAAA